MPGMAEIKQVASSDPTLFENDSQIHTFWRCSTCGDPVTPDRPGLAKWGSGLADGTFTVVHKVRPCDDGAGRWEDLNRFMSSLLSNSLGLKAAAELASHPSFSADDPRKGVSTLDMKPYGINFAELLELSADEAFLVDAYARFRNLAEDMKSWMMSPAHRDALEMLYWLYDALRGISTIASDPERKAALRNEKTIVAVAVLSHYLRPPGVANEPDYYLRDLDSLPDGAKIRAAIERHRSERGKEFNW